MFWLPPGRFSTTTGCGQTPCRPWAIARAMVSGDPPGVSGTMIRIGRSGKPCPHPRSGRRVRATAASHLIIGVSPVLRRPVYLFTRRYYDGLSQGGSPPMLTPEELAQLEGAETLFPSPIPVQCASSDEYMPSPQSARQKEFEARVKQIGAELAKKHGITRRRFFKTAG